MVPPAARLVADRLAMRYGARRLFADLSFELAPGDRLAILGANGSGKSTLLRVLAGVLTPTSGSARLSVAGAPVAPEAHARSVGFAAPALHLYDTLSATENLAFVARLRGLPDAERRVAAVLARVGLAARGDDRVGAFSTGMRQRLRLAAALLPDPPILLLDEPGAALDADGAALVREIVAGSAATVVLATNDDREAALCRRSVQIG